MYKIKSKGSLKVGLWHGNWGGDEYMYLYYILNENEFNHIPYFKNY